MVAPQFRITGALRNNGWGVQGVGAGMGAGQVGRPGLVRQHNGGELTGQQQRHALGHAVGAGTLEGEHAVRMHIAHRQRLHEDVVGGAERPADRPRFGARLGVVNRRCGRHRLALLPVAVGFFQKTHRGLLMAMAPP